MLLLTVVIGFLVAGAYLLVQSYRLPVSPVRNRLPSGRWWPWVTALSLLLVPLVFVVFSYIAGLVANVAVEPIPADPDPSPWWSVAAGIGVPVFLALMLWLAWFRPFAVAVLLLISWPALPVAWYAQEILVMLSESAELGYTAWGPVFEPILLFVLLAPSFLVALLLIATARTLDEQPVRVPGPVSTPADRPASTVAAEHAARWSGKIITLKVFASLLLVLGVVALRLYSVWDIRGVRSVTENWGGLLWALAIMLVVLAGLVWLWPRLAGLILLCSGLIVAAIGVLVPLLTQAQTTQVLGLVAYTFPAVMVACLLLLISHLERRDEASARVEASGGESARSPQTVVAPSEERTHPNH
ncbi:MAG: hypothetical protein K0U64_02275 [Actinomycetia bacterium]|nr:hypothetical protein [Actinomycetes bacterium]